MPYGVSEFLSRQGVDLRDPENEQVLKLLAPISTFVTAFRNQTPPVDQTTSIIPAVQALDATPLLETIHADLRNQAFSEIAEACDTALRNDDFPWDLDALECFRRVLARAAADPHPQPDPKRDEAFQDSPSWGMPAARIAAAEAIMLLARHHQIMDDTLRTLITTLSTDASALVRYQVAARLTCLSETAVPLLWSFLEQQAQKEENCGVLQGTLRTLRCCAYMDPPRVAQLAQRIVDRIPKEGQGAKNVRESCTVCVRGTAGCR